LHGSKLPRNSAEPVPTGTITKPRWLKARGAVLWRRLIGVLRPIGLATSADQIALARYCDNLDRWLRTRAWLDKNGETYIVYKDDNVTVRYVGQYPQVSILRHLDAALSKAEAQYGMTAAARVRLVAPTSEKAEDEFKAYLQKKRR
jgi:P27 family predicted phage terminase small subunit